MLRVCRAPLSDELQFVAVLVSTHVCPKSVIDKLKFVGHFARAPLSHELQFVAVLVSTQVRPKSVIDKLKEALKKSSSRNI
jgi:hypothetical protein